MGTIKSIKEIIPEISQKQQESNPSPSKVRYHIHGKDIAWDKKQIELFWRKEFLGSMMEIEPRFT